MSSTINWNDVIKKEARGVNDEDFGEVQDVSNGYVFVQKIMINKEKFFIPQDKVENFDGDILRFRVSADEAASSYEGDSFPSSSPSPSSSSSSAPSNNQKTAEEEITIPVKAEKLDVTKKVEESQTTITKEPVTETKSIEVPVTHEEISVERRKPTGDTSTSQKPITSKENIEIPLKREEADVSKTSYVKEEVVIKKKPVTETKEVTEDVTSERISTPNM